MKPMAPAVEARPGLRHHVLAVGLALAGGVFGILGAFVQELRSGGGILLLFFGAPIIEEVVKPIGIYLLITRWPQAIRGRLYMGVLGAMAGATFGMLESALYVSLYVSDPSQAFFVYRFTVTVFLHGVASFIVGTGVTVALWEWANGRGPFPKWSRNAYLTAIVLHSLYNITAFSLGVAGVLDFFDD